MHLAFCLCSASAFPLFLSVDVVLSLSFILPFALSELDILILIFLLGVLPLELISHSQLLFQCFTNTVPHQVSSISSISFVNGLGLNLLFKISLLPYLTFS